MTPVASQAPFTWVNRSSWGRTRGLTFAGKSPEAGDCPATTVITASASVSDTGNSDSGGETTRLVTARASSLEERVAVNGRHARCAVVILIDNISTVHTIAGMAFDPAPDSLLP